MTAAVRFQTEVTFIRGSADADRLRRAFAERHVPFAPENVTTRADLSATPSRARLRLALRYRLPQQGHFHELGTAAWYAIGDCVASGLAGADPKLGRVHVFPADAARELVPAPRGKGHGFAVHALVYGDVTAKVADVHAALQRPGSKLSDVEVVPQTDGSGSGVLLLSGRVEGNRGAAQQTVRRAVADALAVTGLAPPQDPQSGADVVAVGRVSLRPVPPKTAPGRPWDHKQGAGAGRPGGPEAPHTRSGFPGH